MSAFVVFIRHATTDSAELATYAEQARLARAGHQPTPLAFYGDIDVLEGSAEEGVAIVAFADKAAARRWYDSPAYQQARVHRQAGADYSVLLVDGVAEH